MVDGEMTSDRKRKGTKVFLLYICTPHHNRRIHCKEKRKKEQTQNRKKGKRANRRQRDKMEYEKKSRIKEKTSGQRGEKR